MTPCAERTGVYAGHLFSLKLARRPVSLASSSACSGVLLHCAPHDTRTNTRHSAPDTSCQTDRALGRAPTGLPRSRRGGLPGMFFEEVKRTEGSHDEKNRPRSPPSAEQEQIPGIKARAGISAHRLARRSATTSSFVDRPGIRDGQYGRARPAWLFRRGFRRFEQCDWRGQHNSRSEY